MCNLQYSIICILAVSAHNGLAEKNSDYGDLQDFEFHSKPSSAPPTGEASRLASTSANLNDVFTPDDDGDLWAVDTDEEQPVLSFDEKEKHLREALMRITMDKSNRPTMTQILPILRGLSKSQRTALAAIVMAQANQHGNQLNYVQVERLFGEKRAIILPILLDIANVMRNATAQHPHQINGRKYDTADIKKRHRRTIDHIKSLQQAKQLLATKSGETKSSFRKSPEYITLYRGSKAAVSSPPNDTSIEILAESAAIDAYETKLENNLVHVTLPMISNRTTTLDEVEDLALNDLNGTDSVERTDRMANETLPKPAMLLSSSRYHIPIRRPTDYMNLRNCEFFGNLCLHAEDYPIMQIMRSIKRHKNVMSAMLAEHPTPAAEYFNQKRNILLQNSMMMSKRREDDDQMDDIMGSNGGSGNGAAGLCPSVVRYARPQMARSATGEWKFIVNTAQHTQTLRLEKCSTPENSCSYLQGNVKSRCIQVYNYHRLLSWDNSRGLHVDIFKVPTCCSCHIDSFREHMMASNTKYSTILADDVDDTDDDGDDGDDDDEEVEYDDVDVDTHKSVAYQYSNGFKKTPKVTKVPKVAMPTAAPPFRPSLMTSMKKVPMQSMLETVKKTKPSAESVLGAYLKPPQTNNDFDTESSNTYKKYLRRPMRTSARDQMATGSELHTDISPIRIIDFFDRPLQRRSSVAASGNTVRHPNIPTISTAPTSAYDLGKRVNYNYHPIIDFFGKESVSTQ